jgi:hypothetical protein
MVATMRKTIESIMSVPPAASWAASLPIQKSTALKPCCSSAPKERNIIAQGNALGLSIDRRFKP